MRFPSGRPQAPLIRVTWKGPGHCRSSRLTLADTRHREPRRRESNTSRSASPSMLNANTVSVIARPGTTANQGDERKPRESLSIRPQQEGWFFHDQVRHADRSRSGLRESSSAPDSMVRPSTPPPCTSHVTASTMSATGRRTETTRRGRRRTRTATGITSRASPTASPRLLR